MIVIVLPAMIWLFGSVVRLSPTRIVTDPFTAQMVPFVIGRITPSAKSASPFARRLRSSPVVGRSQTVSLMSPLIVSASTRFSAPCVSLT